MSSQEAPQNNTVPSADTPSYARPLEGDDQWVIGSSHRRYSELSDNEREALANHTPTYSPPADGEVVLGSSHTGVQHVDSTSTNSADNTNTSN